MAYPLTGSPVRSLDVPPMATGRRLRAMMTITRYRILTAVSSGKGLGYFRWFMVFCHYLILLVRINPPTPPYYILRGHTATPTLYTDSVGDTKITLYIRSIYRAKTESCDTETTPAPKHYAVPQIDTAISICPNRNFIHLSHRSDSVRNLVNTVSSTGISAVRIERDIAICTILPE